MLIMADGKNSVGVRRIFAGSDRDDALQFFGAASVDALDARVRVGGMQNLADEHAGKAEVVGVLACAGGLARGVNHGDGFADDGEGVWHWFVAPASARLPCSLTPSIVVISCPSQLAASMVQESMGVPSSSTVQAPHEESSQPLLEPVSCRSWRSASSSTLLGSIASSCERPLIRNSMSSFFIRAFSRWSLAVQVLWL